MGASESLDRGRLRTDGGRPSPPNIARGCEKRREGVLPVRAQSVGQRRRRWVWVWAWLFIVCDGMMNSVDGQCGVRTSRSRRTCMYSSTAICLTLAIKHTHTKSAITGTFFFSFDFFPSCAVAGWLAYGGAPTGGFVSYSIQDEQCLGYGLLGWEIITADQGRS